MKYEAELNFIVKEMKSSYELFFTNAPKQVIQKAKHDIVTDIDKNIEAYITDAVHKSFPGDVVMGEEMSSGTGVLNRTWTIDPIDGTFNMAAGAKLYGIQCSLIEKNEIVVAAIFLPLFHETITAVKGEGCFLNGKSVTANKDFSIDNAMVSFGDYPHKKTSRIADWQHTAISNLYGIIAKIRMFGAACIDFAFVATGRTEGAVVITNNLWDIAPGILICREAGARVLDLKGAEYKLGSEGVIVGADDRVSAMLADSFSLDRRIITPLSSKEYDGVIFDLDGVVLDTESYHLKAWNKALEKYRISISEEEYFPLKSTGREHILSCIIAKYSLNLSEDEKKALLIEKGVWYKKYNDILTEEDSLPGVRDYLKLLRRKYTKIGLATSGKDACAVLKRFGLHDEFEFVIDGNSNVKKKPAPDMFLALAEAMRVSPDKCVVFEDSMAGINGALTGGFDVVQVGGKAMVDGPIVVIEDFNCFLENF